MTESLRLIDFDESDEPGRWRSIDDGIMGGRSSSRLVSCQPGACFQGRISLADGGGFASMRRPIRLPRHCRALVLRGRGDGRRYQLRLKMDRLNDGVVYAAAFTARGGWRRLQLPLSRFEPRYRGRVVADAVPLDVSRVVQVGLLVGDGQRGEFSLQLAELTAIVG